MKANIEKRQACLSKRKTNCLLWKAVEKLLKSKQKIKTMSRRLLSWGGCNWFSNMSQRMQLFSEMPFISWALACCTCGSVELQTLAKHNSTHYTHTKLLTFDSQTSIVQKMASQKVEMLVTETHEASTFSQLWIIDIDSWLINKPQNITNNWSACCYYRIEVRLKTETNLR